jgi:PadR family transcriptional regulator PadR
MQKGPRLSHATLKVLRAFMDNPARGLAGSDIWRETGVWSGTLYPMLARLKAAGWLSAEWESVDPAKVGRPRKRIYRLTGLGQQSARHALSELAIVGDNAWATT